MELLGSTTNSPYALTACVIAYVFFKRATHNASVQKRSCPSHLGNKSL